MTDFLMVINSQKVFLVARQEQPHRFFKKTGGSEKDGDEMAALICHLIIKN